MRNTFAWALIGATLLTAAACSSGNGVALRFTRGQKVPDLYIKVTEFTPESVTFRIQVKFTQKKLYHLLLDEEQNRLAEDWFQTVRVGKNAYTAQLMVKPGVTLRPGVRYRLCIGDQNPDLVSRHYSSYKCLVDFEFVLPEK